MLHYLLQILLTFRTALTLICPHTDSTRQLTHFLTFLYLLSSTRYFKIALLISYLSSILIGKIKGIEQITIPLDNVVLAVMLIWTIVKVFELKDKMMDYMVGSAKSRCKDCGSTVDKEQCSKCQFLQKYKVQQKKIQ